MSEFVEIPLASYDADAFRGFVGANAFDLGDARACMWLSQLAYETRLPDKIDAVGALWELERIVPIGARKAGLASFDTHGVTAKRGTSHFIAFAGTDPAVWQNLATDLDVGLTANNVHHGFEAALAGVRGEVDAAIQACKQAHGSLFVTGHSLGAALAVLASEVAFRADCPPRATYVFGCPRVGGTTFAQGYDNDLGSSTYRLVHGADIVASIPSSAAGYRHVGRPLSCASNQRFSAGALMPVGIDVPQLLANVLRDATGRIGQVLHGQLLSLPGEGSFGPLFALLPSQLRDHLPDRYRAALAG
ncbi:MAG TPA: lipase family protein [Usitatibacter sp.]|nr:lipase family protein [Usitatibacter sp.]